MSDPPPQKRAEPAPNVFGDESLSDVTVFVENQDFIVHRMVLASRSDYFKALFYGGFKETKKSRVEIKGVSTDMFKRIVEIIYNGRMSECETLRYPINTEIRADKRTFYHHMGNDVSHVKDALHKFWNFVNELLAVADGFNVSDLVLGSLQEECKFECGRDNCYFCLNLYMFAFENKMPILDKFKQKFKTEDYEAWSTAIFNDAAPMRQPLRQLAPEEHVVLMKKFTK